MFCCWKLRFEGFVLMGVEDFPGIRFRRLAPAGDAGGVCCDENGAAIGSIRLLDKTVSGFAPRPLEDLNQVFAFVLGRPVDSSDMVRPRRPRRTWSVTGVLGDRW
jgi:hypothetical protein